MGWGRERWIVVRREAERVAPRRKARREMAEGEWEVKGEVSAVEEEEDVGVEGEEEGGVEAGVSRGWPFEWLVWGSQGLEARDERGSAIGGGVMPWFRLRPVRPEFIISFGYVMRTVPRLLGR